jgi:hypothetical protein
MKMHARSTWMNDRFLRVGTKITNEYQRCTPDRETTVNHPIRPRVNIDRLPRRHPDDHVSDEADPGASSSATNLHDQF